MAGILLTAQTPEVALVAATAKTTLQLLAAANHRVKVRGIAMYFDGTSPTAEPVQWVLVRQTGAGTATALNTGSATNGTLNKDDPDASETIQSSGQYNFTVEPTSDDLILDAGECHPQSGYEVFYPLGQEKILKGGGRIGLKITAPAAVNVRAKMHLEE